MLKGSSKDDYLPPRVMELFQVPGEMMVNSLHEISLPLAMLRYGNNPSSRAKIVRDEFKDN